MWAKLNPLNWMRAVDEWMRRMDYQGGHHLDRVEAT